MKREVSSKTNKVTVCVVTYNQEKFIRQCLQSLIDQDTDFPFDIIVADDGSNDGTRGIIQEFAQQYPDIVKPVFHETNIGPYANFVFVHEQATGDYIAHMDGDDYALPGKLQAQVDFLENNPDCNLVWHRMLVKNESTGMMVEDLLDVRKFPAQGFRRGDILRLISVGMNSSKMYRAACRPFERPPFPVVDYFANVEQVGGGCAKFVGDKPLGVYRAGIGIASAGNVTRVILKDCFLYFAKKYPEHREDIAGAALALFLAALKNRRWENCRLFGGVLLKTFRPQTLRAMFADRSLLAMFRIPPAIRTGDH